MEQIRENRIMRGSFKLNMKYHLAVKTLSIIKDHKEKIKICQKQNRKINK